MSPTEQDLAQFITGYVECALWSESVEEAFAAEHGGAPDAPLERFFTSDDLAPDAQIRIREDCGAFLHAHATDLALYCDLADAGHDFLLTRNGHGTGFGDRGLAELGDRLTTAAESYGPAHFYVGDNQRIYVGLMTAGELRKAEARAQRAFRSYKTATQLRDELVLRALSEGWTHSQVAEATGLTRGRIGQIAMKGNA